MSDVERISLAIDAPLLERFDQLIGRAGHTNRSEAIRDLVRERLAQRDLDDDELAVATVTLVYDHKKRALSDRLIEVGHDHHEEVIANLHVHLDRVNCLEVVVLRGRVQELRHVAEHLIGMKGVKHGQLVLVPAES